MWAFETWATQDEHQMFVESEQTDYVNDVFMLDWQLHFGYRRLFLEAFLCYAKNLK